MAVAECRSPNAGCRSPVAGYLPLLSRTNLGHNAVVTGVARFLSSNARSERGTDDGERRRLDLRTALLGLGALAAGYLVGRRLRSADRPSAGDIRERAGAALPGDGVEVPIGNTGEEGTDADVAGTDPTLEEVDERTGGEAGTDEPAEAAMEGRAEEDVEEEPAEPGEMHVDEEIAEEVLEEDGAEDETEE